MTQEEARIIVENAKPITSIKRSATININDRQENNSFKNIMRKWQKK